MIDARTFTVTIAGHPAADIDDIITTLTFVHPGWDVTAVEILEAGE